MSIPTDPFYLLMVFLVTLGVIGNSYEFYAKSQGWPVGARFSSWSAGSFIMVPLSVGIVWYFEGWVPALIALVGGFALAFLLTILLRQYVQVLWVISMVTVFVSVGVAVLARLAP